MLLPASSPQGHLVRGGGETAGPSGQPKVAQSGLGPKPRWAGQANSCRPVSLRCPVGMGLPTVAEQGCQEDLRGPLSLRPPQSCSHLSPSAPAPVAENCPFPKRKNEARQVEYQETWVLKDEGWESRVLGPDLCPSLSEQPRALPFHGG